jgi:hypothetical protein
LLLLDHAEIQLLFLFLELVGVGERVVRQRRVFDVAARADGEVNAAVGAAQDKAIVGQVATPVGEGEAVDGSILQVIPLR